jgi:hypothetical protein
MPIYEYEKKGKTHYRYAFELLKRWRVINPTKYLPINIMKLR